MVFPVPVIDLVRHYGSRALLRGGWRELARRFPVARPGVPSHAASRPDLPPDPSAEDGASEVVSHGARFAVRPYSTDHGIIGETWAVYIEPLRAAGRTRFDHVIDLGAQIGGFSVHLAMNAEVRRITAIEPHPENFALLRKNILRNAVGDRVTARQAAASDRDGIARLAPSTTDNTGGHHLTLGTQRVSIAVESLDVRGLVAPDDTDVVLKLDIEGWELPVLRRLRPLLPRISAIVGELHSGRYADPADCLALLRQAGYQVRLEGDPRIPGFIALRR